MLPAAVSAQPEKIKLHALFQGKAIIMVGDQRRLLAEGETSPEGIKLVSTHPRREEALVERDGEQFSLRLGIVMSSSGAKKDKGPETATLFADGRGQFYGTAIINNIPTMVLVDTGATDIAMNSVTAKRLGIPYKTVGQPSYASTASGVTPMYSLTLTKVKLGGIQLYNVKAGVIEGSFPREVLLGMSFLNKVEMKRDGSKMELIKK